LIKVEIQEGFPNVEVIIKCPQDTEEIRRIEALLLGYKQQLSCKKDGIMHLIDKRDVIYFESVDRCCFLYTVDNVFETAMKLYEIEGIFSGMGFIRSSKSQIINIAKIKSLCPDFGGRIEAIMENGYQIIVSRQYAKQLKERMGIK
jgi:DNA-binding LytR/AlgR family response regulator